LVCKTENKKHSRIFRKFQIYTGYASMKWKIPYNMTKHTKHLKNKKHSRIFRKFQIYTGYASMKWTILYNMTKNTKHLKNKNHKTIQNIQTYSTDQIYTGRASVTSVIWLNFGYLEAFGQIL